MFEEKKPFISLDVLISHNTIHLTIESQKGKDFSRFVVYVISRKIKHAGKDLEIYDCTPAELTIPKTVFVISNAEETIKEFKTVLDVSISLVKHLDFNLP